MEIKDTAIEKVIPYARNPRRNDAAVAAVAASIREFGFRQPIVVDEDMTVLVGHTRLKAAQSLGLAKVPVHIAKGLTESQRKAYRIADNKLNDLAVWDDEMLALELVDLQNANYDLELTGFGEEEIKKLEAMANATTDGLTDPDDVPDVDTTDTRTKLGDIWLLGKHRVMCGDSTVANDVAALMDGAKVDAVVTDPPYGANFDPTKNRGGKFGGKAASGKVVPSIARPKIIGDETNDTAKTAWALWESLALLHIWWGANYYADALPVSSCWLIWDKENGTTDFADVELAWHNRPRAARLFKHMWNGMVKASERGERRLHGTQKPIALMAWCIEQLGDGVVIVAEPFLGSGTTLIAAETTGRICYGMEINPQYVDVTVKRWEMFTGKTAVKLEAKA